MADRTITTDLVGRDRSLSSTLDKAGNSASKNSKKFADFNKSVEDIGKSTSKVTGGYLKWTAVLGGGATVLVHAAAAIHAVVAEGIALSGTLGTLPGIAAAGALGMVTMKLATEGFGAAVKNANPKKLSAEMKALSPEARATAKAIASIKPELKGVQQAVQNRFFAGMSADIRPLAASYLPLLRTNLGSIGGSLGGVVKDFASFLRTPAALKLVSSLLSNVALAFTFIRAAAKPLGPAILKIVSASADFLPSITVGLGGLTSRFGAFISRVTASGQFTDWIRKGLDAVISLGQGIKTVAHAVDGFVSGLSTGGGVGGFFAQIKAGSDAVTKVLPQVLTAVEALAPAFVNMVQASGGSFAKTLQLASSAAISLAPTLTSMTHALIPLAPLLGHIVPLIYLGAKGMQVYTLGVKAAAVASKLWTGAQWLLNTALDANPIGLIIVAVAALAVGLVVLYKRSATFRDIVQTAMKAVETAFHAVVDVVKAVANEFKAHFHTISNVILTLTMPLYHVVSHIQDIIAVGKVLASAVPGAFRAVVNAIGKVNRAVTSLQSDIVRVFKGAPGWLFSAGKWVVQGLINGLKAEAGSVASEAKSIASSIPSAVSSFLGIHSPSTVMAALGGWTMQGFINGIKGKRKEAHAAMEDVKSQLQKDISHWNSVYDSHNQKLKDLKSSYADLKNSIKDAFAGTAITDRGGSFSDVLASYQQSITQGRASAAALAKLKKLGLRSDLLQQLAAGGSGSLGLEQSILSAGKGAVGLLNSDQSTMLGIGNGAGTTVANATYATAISAETRETARLQKAVADLHKAMDKLTAAMKEPGHIDSARLRAALYKILRQAGALAGG